MIKRVGISRLTYVDEKTFDEKDFKCRDSRVMDRFSKMVITAARNLIRPDEQKGQALPSERMALVLATSTGPSGSVSEMADIMQDRGVIGINPSKFPNIMLSTPLCRVTIDLALKGPSIPLYIGPGKMSQAFRYGLIQIEKGSADGVIIIYANEGKGCFGLFLEEKESALRRGVELRFRKEGEL